MLTREASKGMCDLYVLTKGEGVVERGFLAVRVPLVSTLSDQGSEEACQEEK